MKIIYIFFKRIFKTIYNFFITLNNDCIDSFSGETTLFIIISFFPFTILLLTLLRYTPLSSEIAINAILSYFPEVLRGYVITIINDVFSPTRTVISLSTITVLWAASKGFLSVVHGFNVVYKTGETRNYFVLRLFSIFYTIIFAIIIIFTLILLVFGNKISSYLVNKIPSYLDITLLIISIRKIVILAVLLVFFLILYIFVPNRKTSFLKELPGAIISSIGWILFSYLFSYYVDHYSNYSSMYGSLTSIILIMIWLYFCMYIVFIGAEINVSIGHLLEHHVKNKKKLKKDLKLSKKQNK